MSSSKLIVIDGHGYIRSRYLRTPDVGGSLPDVVASQLNDVGRELLAEHGSGGACRRSRPQSATWMAWSHIPPSRAVTPSFTLQTALLDADGRVGASYEVIGLPTTYFVRADGGIQGRNMGQMDEAVLDAHLSAFAP